MTNREGAGSSAPEQRRVGRLMSGLRIVSLCTLLSRVLGMVREIAMAALFGAGPVLDAFTTAFAIPNLARALFGEGALSTAFQPLFIREHEQHGRDAANRLASAVFVCVALGLSTFVAVAELLLAGVLLIIPLGCSTRLWLTLTSVMLPYLVLICLTAQVGAVLNVAGRFAWPAFVPVLFNIGSLVAIGIVQSLNLDAEHRALWLAFAVLVTGFVQLAASWPILVRSGFQFDRHWREAKGRIRELLRVMAPIVLGLSITQVNTLCDRLIAFGFSEPEARPQVSLDCDARKVDSEPLAIADTSSGFVVDLSKSAAPLPAGTASALNLGQRLYQFPLGLLGVALGTVIFPLLTRHAERGEMQSLRDDLALGLRLVMVIGLPASAGLWLLAEPLAVVMFQRGQFTVEDARQTAQMIEAYGIGVWAFCGLLIIQRAYYAIGDRRTPLKIGIAMALLNLALNLGLIWVIGGRGLALSTSLCGILQFGLCLSFIQAHIGCLPWSSLASHSIRASIATLVMTAVGGWTATVFQTNGNGRLVTLGGTVITSVVIYAVFCRVLHLDEFWLLLRPQRGTVVNENTTATRLNDNE